MAESNLEGLQQGLSTNGINEGTGGTPQMEDTIASLLQADNAVEQAWTFAHSYPSM